MLTYLIQVVQNALATSILVGMLFTFVQVGKKPRQKQWLLWGFAAGTVFALILSTLRARTALINKEYWTVYILSVAVLATILFLVLSWSSLHRKRSALHERTLYAVCACLMSLLLLYCLSDIFLYPTDFLITGESILGTDFLFKSIGYLGGLLVVGLSGLALYKVGTSLSFRLAHVLLTAGLTINMVDQITVIVQILLARRVIPMSKGLFEFIKLTVNYDDYFLYAIMVITILSPAVLWLNNRHSTKLYSNPAEHRIIRATSRKQRRWCAVVLLGYVLSILCLTVVKTYEEREVALSPAEPMSVVGNESVIPIESINDGRLHRFVYTASDGTEVWFIVIKKNETNSYGVGLDACDICGPTGYYERGNHEVVCKQCDVVMNINTIGFKGGCNPVPLPYTINADNMVINNQDLENEKRRF